jgi:hypothetical protein
MNLKEAVGVTSLYIDKETGKEVGHREFYSRAIKLLGGLDKVIPFIPFSLIEIKDMLKKDEHMNFRMDLWDAASGFRCQLANCWFVGCGITPLYNKAKITAFSCSDGVCILKEAARQWAERRY